MSTGPDGVRMPLSQWATSALVTAKWSAICCCVQPSDCRKRLSCFFVGRISYNVAWCVR